MNAKLLALLLLGSTTLIAFATPSAGAAATFCTGATDAVSTNDCPYMLCYGMSHDQWGRVRCTYTIYWPCQYCVPPEWD